MDEQTLALFLSLCETENTRDTAALTRVNQSNISRALARLESDLGVELFHRRGRRLELNRYGELFRTTAERAVEELAAGRRRVLEDSAAESGVIHLGFLQSLARELLPEVISAHRAVYPDSRFTLHQGFGWDLYERLAHGTLDAAVVTPPRAAATEATFHVLRRQQLCVAVPPGHRLVGLHEARLSDLAGEPFVAFASTTDLRRVVDRLFAEARLEPVTAFESGEIETVRGLIAAGLGVGVVPRPRLAQPGDPVYLPLSPAAERLIGVAWMRPSSPAAAAFVGRLSTL